MPEWISVKERVPTLEDYNKSGYVIVAFENGAVRQGYKYTYEDRWAFEDEHNKVTHWMRFPEAPGEVMS